MIKMRALSHSPLWTVGCLAIATSIFWPPAALRAQEVGKIGFDGLVEVRGVASDLDLDENEEIDSSGAGIRASIGAAVKTDPDTQIRLQVDGSIFEFRDDGRDSLESVGARVQVTHEVSSQVQLQLFARRVENIAVLEANSADETSAGVRFQWERGNDRVRLTAEYRDREYDTRTPGDGEGYRLTGEYNRRFGPYHWLQLRLRHEDQESTNALRRSYQRQIARIKYSYPIAPRLRLRPSLEYRQWKYDARIARGDLLGDLREDSYIAPGIDLAWGRSNRGFYALANAEYRFRTSNDVRYESDAIRAGLRIGYRF